MDKQYIIDFFDSYAPNWDADQPDNSHVINIIMDKAGIGPGQDVLDVACGTGILFPYYLKRGVRSITGVDISPKMAALAKDKHREQANIQVVCGDVEELQFEKSFQQIVLYNAFPHFPQPELLMSRLYDLAVPGARLTIAHGASRAAIDNHHEGAAAHVSMGLMPAGKLMEIMRACFKVDILISDTKMYMVSGTKR